MGYCYKYVIHLTYVHASVHSSLKPSCIQCFCNVFISHLSFWAIAKKIGREISSVLVYLACWKSMMWCNKWSSQVNLEKQYTRHTSTVSSSPELLILMIIMMTTTTTEPNHHLPLWLLPLPYKQKDATATVRVCRAFVYTTRRDQWRFFTWVHSPVELVPLKKPKRENMVERKSAAKKKETRDVILMSRKESKLFGFCTFLSCNTTLLTYQYERIILSSSIKREKISVFTFHYFIFMLLLLLTIQMMIISVCVMWYIKIQEVTR